MKQNAFNSMLLQINSGLKQRRPYIFCPLSVKNVMVLNVLLEKGFILGFFKSSNDSYKLCIFLKYWDNKPLLIKISSIKKNDLKNFVKYNKLKGDLQSQGLFIFSSNIGGFLINGMMNSFGNHNIRTGGTLIVKLEV